jgi:biopolymer transport protein ExbB
MRYLLAFLVLVTSQSLYSQDILDELEGNQAPKVAPTAEVQPAPVQPTGQATETEPKQPTDTPEQPAAKVDADNEDAAEESDQAEGNSFFQRLSNSAFIQWLDGISRTGPLGLIRDGGLFMWPILLLGVLAAGVIIERFRSLRLLDSDSSKLRREVAQLLQEDRVEEAFRMCDNSQGPVPAVLACGLRKYIVLRRLNYDAARTEKQVVDAMEDHSVHIVAALERHLPILATISSVAPMLGFLGTVAGMITSFEDIEAMFDGGASGGTNIVQEAAAGISIALITTCFGLIIGIPAFIAYNYFTGIINGFVLEVEESTTELIEGVTLQLALAGADQSNVRQQPVAMNVGET